jgi:RNA polymerase II elongation factor ELL
MHTPGHRRFPSKGFKQQHLAPSSLGSPMLSAPSSPMAKPPTSQPAGSRDLILKALRVPLIHLLAVQPSTDAYLAETCRTSLSNVKEILPKIAKQVQDTDKYQLTEKSIKEINPWKFPYKSSEDRQKAIDAAIKLFDRSRLPKDDKLWQILLPVHERGQGKCLSRLNVKPPEPKPSTPLHKMPKLNDKKPAAPAKKAEDKDSEKDVKKKAREVKDLQEAAQVKPKKAVKAKPASQKVRESVSRPNPSSQATASANRTPPPASASAPSSTRRPAPSHRHTPSVDTMKPTDPSRIRTKKVPITKSTAAPQVTPKTATQTPTAKNISQTRDRPSRPVRPAMPVNTKPKNPSPLSASPPVNASDFEESHPVHKALSGAPSPAKTSSTNSDRSLKRKADTDNHDTKLSVKQPRLEKATPTHKGSSTGGRANGSTPASATSLKRKSDDSSTSDTPTSKVRKVANVDTGVASRYTNSNNDQHPSPGDFSSSGASPGPRLSFRQSVELSRKFKQYYKKYEELYWRLAESPTPPTEAQRNELMKMHKKLAEMKREINEAVGVKK